MKELHHVHSLDCASCPSHAFRGKEGGAGGIRTVVPSDGREIARIALELVRRLLRRTNGNGPPGTMIRQEARKRLSNIHGKLVAYQMDIMDHETCVRQWIGGSGQWGHGSIYEKLHLAELVSIIIATAPYACARCALVVPSSYTSSRRRYQRPDDVSPDPDLGLFVSSLSRRNLSSLRSLQACR